MEFMYEFNASEDKNHSHYQCSKNSPEQHLVLIACWYTEVGEDHDDDKNIVNAQGFFNEVSSKKFQRCLLIKIIKYEKVEQHSQTDPNCCPGQRFLY
jgi:hypothetical protein